MTPKELISLARHTNNITKATDNIEKNLLSLEARLLQKPCRECVVLQLKIAMSEPKSKTTRDYRTKIHNGCKSGIKKIIQEAEAEA